MDRVDRKRVILAKTAWSERYDSLGEGDDPRGNHANLRLGAGHEAYNFRPSEKEGKYYGYFRAHGGPNGGRLNLRRIDNQSAGSQLGGLTVVWVSRPPEGKLRVVGWYRDAIAFGETQTEGSPWTHRLYESESNPGGKGSYLCTASVQRSVLLPADQRGQWLLPKSVGRIMGRTDVLYPMVDGHSARVAPWVQEVEGLISRIEHFEPTSTPPLDHDEREVTSTLHGQGLAPDPKRRELIERTAMEHAAEHFRRQGYSVVDVSANHPFDLECEKGSDRLQVEVKGTSGDGSRVILTEREFRHAPPAGWERVLYVLPQITQLEDGKLIEAEPRVVRPFNPLDWASKPISYILNLDDH